MDLGKIGENLFIDKVSGAGFIIEDLTANPDYWEIDVDMRVTNPATNNSRLIEVKYDARIAKTNNLFIEIYNNHSKGGKGWWNFCKADYIAYGDANAQCFHFFARDDLKNIIKSKWHKTARCGDDSSGLLVSLDEIKSVPSYRLI